MEKKRLNEIRQRLYEEEKERQKQEYIRIQQIIEEEERVNFEKLIQREIELATKQAQAKMEQNLMKLNTEEFEESYESEEFEEEF